jgi:hypothetical protein
LNIDLISLLVLQKQVGHCGCTDSIVPVSSCFVLGKDAVASLDTGNGFVAVCRFDQGAAVEGLGVGC